MSRMLESARVSPAPPCARMSLPGCRTVEASDLDDEVDFGSA
jgi:hypothetical protein